MPEKPKNEKDEESEPEKLPARKPETGDEDSWSVDQRKRDYYYDDAHGYEIYNPEDDDDDDDE